MKNIRTDLALEAHETAVSSGQEANGVKFSESDIDGYKLTTVKILDEQGEKLTPPSDVESIVIPTGSFSSLVEAELIPRSKAVKKTLTIPSWLNIAAEAQGINFSGVLQDALIEKLDLIHYR